MRRDSEHQGATSFHVRTTGMPLIVVDGQRHRVTGGNGLIGEPPTDGTPVLRGLSVPMGLRPQLPEEAGTSNPTSAAEIAELGRAMTTSKERRSARRAAPRRRGLRQ